MRSSYISKALKESQKGKKPLQGHENEIVLVSDESKERKRKKGITVPCMFDQKRCFIITCQEEYSKILVVYVLGWVLRSVYVLGNTIRYYFKSKMEFKRQISIYNF